jgi:hypothetical protein
MTMDRPTCAWEIPGGGHRWIQAETVLPDDEGNRHVGPFLVEAETSTAESPRPETHPALFHLFAEVAPEQEGILAFADRHGTIVGARREIRPLARSQATLGVPLDAWRCDISAMQRLIALWGLIRRGDEAALARYFSQPTQAATGATVHFSSHPKAGKGGASSALGFLREREEISFTDAEPELAERVRQGDVLLPAQRYLQAQLAHFFLHREVALRLDMGWDDRRRRPRLVAEYTSMDAAVWGQFASAVSEDRSFAQCRECATWFEVAPDAARTNRRFCSNSCRSKAYRERQDRARRLFMARRTFEQIAEELDSDLATVKRWITGSKE